MQVRVYRNLTKRCWSIQHKVPGKGWRLLKHANLVSLDNAFPLIQEAGRQRVIKEGKKYVHAFICGELSETHLNRGFQLRYNPKAWPGFTYVPSVLKAEGDLFTGARKVTLDINGTVLSSS